ncbi:MAG: eIF2 kinase Gcn2p negative regulator [Peltula sp. TS41687]|nr:MAG: eIF2 kinase Gcn2p negative regulator [Peltula sp. TS41687]
MNEEFLEELEAINAIYGTDTLRGDEEKTSFILRLPGGSICIRLQFPSEYPKLPPVIAGTHGAGETSVKGEANQAVLRCKTVLQQIFQPGHPCIFDLMEELRLVLLILKRPELLTRQSRHLDSIQMRKLLAVARR